MIVLDTHVWIWWVSEPERLSPTAREAVEGAANMGLCPISCWELATKVRRGQLRLDRELEVWVAQALARPRLFLTELSADIAVQAGRWTAREFHGDPADRLIAATGLALRAPLVTKDRRIRSFEKVRTIW